MPKKIIYDNGDGGVSVINPTSMKNINTVSLSVIRAGDSPEEVARKEKAILAQTFILGIEDPTEEDWVTFVAMKDVPVGASHSIVEEDTLPTDRTFRGAWKKAGPNINIDLPAARVIHQDHIERIKDREMKLLADQIVIQQALGNDVTALQAGIQGIQTAVDNVGPNINAAGTPAILKAVWPVGLPTE